MTQCQFWSQIFNLTCDSSEMCLCRSQTPYLLLSPAQLLSMPIQLLQQASLAHLGLCLSMVQNSLHLHQGFFSGPGKGVLPTNPHLHPPPRPTFLGLFWGSKIFPRFLPKFFALRLAKKNQQTPPPDLFLKKIPDLYSLLPLHLQMVQCLMPFHFSLLQTLVCLSCIMVLHLELIHQVLFSPSCLRILQALQSNHSICIRPLLLLDVIMAFCNIVHVNDYCQHCILLKKILQKYLC